MIYVPSEVKQEYIRARYWKYFANKIGVIESLENEYSIEDTIYDFYGIRFVEYKGVFDEDTNRFSNDFKNDFVLPEVICKRNVVDIDFDEKSFGYTINNNFYSYIYDNFETIGSETIEIADSNGRLHSIVIENVLFNIEGTKILKYLGTRNELEIPSVIEGKQVLEIAEYSFNYKMNRLSIPEGILSINENAFSLAENLTEIVLPLSLIEIGKYAFSGTKIDQISFGINLNDINFSMLYEIGDYAFYNCKDIDNFIVPAQVNTIGKYAFCADLNNNEKMNLHDIQFLGDNMYSIGEYAFGNCNIKTITLPKELKNIGEGVFKNCYYLMSIYLNNESDDSNITNLESNLTDLFAGCYFAKVYVKNNKLSQYRNDNIWKTYSNRIYSSEKIFNGYVISIIDETEKKANLVHYLGEEQNVVIPSIINGYKIVAIESYTFAYNISSVFIPNTIIDINPYSFYCSSVKNVYFEEDSDCSLIGRYAFYSSLIEEISIPIKVETISDYAFAKTNLTNIDFEYSSLLEINESSVDDISFGGHCFSENKNLVSITLPRRTSNINEYAFYNNKNLVEINLPEDGWLITINNYVFKNCISLKEIVVPFSVINMYSGVFDGCIKLNSVFIMRGKDGELVTQIDKLTSIGGGIFNNINNPFLKVFVPKNSLTEYRNLSNWKNYAGYSDNGVYEPLSYPDYIIPNMIYGDYAYSIVDGGIEITQYRGNEKELIISSSMTINDINYSVKSLGRKFGNKELKSVEFEEGTHQIINVFAFSDCISLEKIVLPIGLESIGEYAFNNCIKLRDINLPANITEIAMGLFQNCQSIEEISIPSKVTDIGTFAFNNCTSLVRVFLNSPEVIEAGSSMFMNTCKQMRIFVNINYLTAYKVKTVWAMFASQILSNYNIYGDYAIETNIDGEVTILQYIGSQEKVYLPSYIQGNKVVAIENYAIISSIKEIHINEDDISYGDDIADKIIVNNLE